MTLKELVKRRGKLVHQKIFARRMGWYKETLINAENEEIGLTDNDLRRYAAMLDQIEEEQNQVEEQKREGVSVSV